MQNKTVIIPNSLVTLKSMHDAIAMGYGWLTGSVLCQGLLIWTLIFG